MKKALRIVGWVVLSALMTFVGYWACARFGVFTWLYEATR